MLAPPLKYLVTSPWMWGLLTMNNRVLGHLHFGPVRCKESPSSPYIFYRKLMESVDADKPSFDNTNLTGILRISEY